MSASSQAFWALAQPDERTAVIAADGEAWTYGRLAERADASARLWRRDAKSLVLLLARNDVPTLAAYLGALRIGDPVLVVDPRTPLAVLATIVENFRPDAIVHPADMADPLLDGYDVVASELGLTISAPAEYDVPAPHPDLAVVIAAGDGTDHGRFVRLSRRNLASQAGAMVASFGLKPDGRVIAALSLAECHWLAIVNAHFQAGATVLASDRSLAAEDFWAFAREQGASCVAGSAYGVELLERSRFDPSRLPTLRMMMLATGNLRPDRLRRLDDAIRKTGVRLATLSGGAEATGCYAHVSAAMIPTKLGAVGVALEGGMLSIDRASGALCYAGPNVALGYAESRADLSRGDDLGGRLTCDGLVRVDADGVYWRSASPVAMPVNRLQAAPISANP